MKWDREYVRNKYGVSYLGQEGIFFPAENCKRLLIFFSSMGEDRYDRYSWFWDDDENWKETSYLFIKDDSFKYFLGDDEKPLRHTFRKMIQQKIDFLNLDISQVYSVGSSMGGYAAIYYASFLGFGGAITLNPQVDYKSSRLHEYDNWERQIRSIGTQWYDLGDFLVKRHIPNIYIEYGNYPADLRAVNSLVESISPLRSNLILNKQDWAGHTVNGLFKETIISTVNYFEQINTINDKYLEL
jgi:pimeloyl-ACP methyl ester carboxylesterase